MTTTELNEIAKDCMVMGVNFSARQSRQNGWVVEVQFQNRTQLVTRRSSWGSNVNGKIDANLNEMVNAAVVRGMNFEVLSNKIIRVEFKPGKFKIISNANQL